MPHEQVYDVSGDSQVVARDVSKAHPMKYTHDEDDEDRSTPPSPSKQAAVSQNPN